MKPQLGQKPTSKKPQSANPFARALAEQERNLMNNPDKKQDANSLFSQALSKTGGQFPEDMSPEQMAKQQEEAEKQRKKEIARKKLHDQINPVDMVDVFSAREKRVKEEIDKVRNELKLLARDVAKLHKEVDITLMAEVSNPGQDGAYYINFFQQLRNWIMLLRQQIKSAQTWMKQMHSKNTKKKKHKKFGAGIDLGASKGFEQSKAVFESMHHENNAVYGG